MDELLRQALTIVRGIWRFRWTALIVAWGVSLVGAAVVLRIPDQFEASARIFVDTQSILKPLMAGLTVQPNVEQQVNMLSRTLLSRPNLEKLVRMADLDLNAANRLQQEALIDNVGRNIQIRNIGRDNLYTLNYRDFDQDKAKRVIQSLVSIFVESGLGASRKDTDSAKVFLDEQIRQAEARLEEAESRLKQFRLRNLELMSDDGTDATSRLRLAADQLAQAQLQLREAEYARDATKTQLDLEKAQRGDASAQNRPLESVPAPALVIATPEIDGRIDAQRRNLDALQQRYTDQHPDIVVTRRLIADLEAQKKKEVAELRRAAEAEALAQARLGTTPQSNPAVQELGRLLAASEVQVASLKARVAEYSSRLALARASMRTAPALEAEAAQLNRDYGIIKKNYEDLVSRRQAAVMSGELEVASGVADFRLIDPPRVSPKPVAPNRVALLPLALAAGLGAGLFLAFAISQLRPTFDRPEDLRVMTGLPTLGVVSMVLSKSDRRSERLGLLRFGTVAALLPLSFAGALAFLVFTGR